jgi:hypothetical protein
MGTGLRLLILNGRLMCGHLLFNNPFSGILVGPRKAESQMVEEIWAEKKIFWHLAQYANGRMLKWS